MNILMCGPAHYEISYSINPWMNTQNGADNNAARSQWIHLADAIAKAGGVLHEMDPVKGLPDIVFTANAGTVYDDQVILSNFAHKERRAEKAHYKKKFQALGKTVIELPETMHYEGAGDALWGHGKATGKTLWCGFGWRSSLEAHGEVRKIWKIDTCYLKLVDPAFYHLDTCFCPLQDDDALVYCGAFDKKSYDTIRYCFYAIDVPANEARKFACNAVCIGKNVIMPADCPVTKKALEEKGYKVFECPMTEFIKSGGACKCLTLKL